MRALRLDESTTMASAEAPETLVLIAAGGERVEAPAAAALACTTVRHAFDDAGGPDEPAIPLPLISGDALRATLRCIARPSTVANEIDEGSVVDGAVSEPHSAVGLSK